MRYLKKFIFLILIAVLFLFISSASGKDKKPVLLYLFWAEGCPYCAKEKIFLSDLKKKYSSLQIKDYEVSLPASIELLRTMSKAYNINPTGVPVTFIGNKAFIGFSEKTASQIEETIKYCLKNTCEDPLYKK